MRFEEKNRRFIQITPETSSEKIRDAKRLDGHRQGLLKEEYDDLVVSTVDKDRAKQIVKILIAKLKQHSKDFESKDQGIKNPFEETIVDCIPDNHLWNMTVNNRLLKYLSIITKVRMDARPKIVDEETGQVYPICIFEDLKEALILMQMGASGIRPYLAIWYNKFFIPAINTLGGKAYEDKDEHGNLIEKEKQVGLTTKQLIEEIQKMPGGSKMSSEELSHKYLTPLVNQGIIDHVESEINRKYHIYFPVEAEKRGSLFSMFDNDKDLRLKVPNPGIFPGKTFLKSKFRILSKRPPSEDPLLGKNFSRYKLLDTDGNEIAVDQLLDKYLSNPELCFAKDYRDPEEKFIFSQPATEVVITGSPNNVIEDSNGSSNSSDKEATKAATRLEHIISIEEFFDDPDLPYRPLPPHTLEQSPCYSIVGSKVQAESEGVKWYYCRLHPGEVNINLETIEHHCKYKDPNAHKAEILKLLQSASVSGGG